VLISFRNFYNITLWSKFRRGVYTAVACDNLGVNNVWLLWDRLFLEKITGSFVIHGEPHGKSKVTFKSRLTSISVRYRKLICRCYNTFVVWRSVFIQCLKKNILTFTYMTIIFVIQYQKSFIMFYCVLFSELIIESDKL
jgi:hypothetical protein